MRGILVILLVLVLLIGAGGAYFFWSESKGEDAASVEAEYLDTDDRFIDVAGMKVRVREQGPTDAPVLIMLHGFTFSLESFDALADALDDEYRVVRYDMRGHGLTGPDPQKRYAPQQRAAHIGEIMDTLGVERATIIGNSLGGLAAWRFAATAPERLDALVLISPGAYPINGVTDEPAEVPAAVQAYLRFAPKPAVDASVSRIFADPDAVSEERREVLRAMMTREGNGEAFVDALNVFTLPDPEPLLGRIEVPTLIIWGADDQVISAQDGVKMEAAITGAELIVLDGIGHVAHEEAPQRVASDIRAFLKGRRSE